MAMYRVAMNQLMKITSRENLFQPCFANDGNCTGSIEDLKQLHDDLKEHGRAFSYHLTKCHLIVQPDFLITAKELCKMKESKLSSDLLLSMICLVSILSLTKPQNSLNCLRNLKKKCKNFSSKCLEFPY